MSNNNWHEKGELPPIGEIVEFFRGDGRGGGANVSVAITNHTVDGQVVFQIPEEPNEFKINGRDKFRPIKSKEDKEREESVDAMFKYFNKGDVYRTDLEALHDAGYHLRLEEVSANSIVKCIEGNTRFMMAKDSANCLLKNFNITRKVK